METITLIPVVLAGGGGTRLWPCSRESYPKQFLALTGEFTLLQQTLLRLTTLGKADTEITLKNYTVDPTLIVCNEEHRFLVAEQAHLVSVHGRPILLEPVGRNTAPALTVAALSVLDNAADSLLLMMPADHAIQNEDAFCAAVASGCELAEDGMIVSFGVVPTQPETGYGYIRQGNSLSSSNNGKSAGHTIVDFVEKPDLNTAAAYVASGIYTWNSGIFLMKASLWLEAIKAFRPDILAACDKAYASGSTDGNFYRLDKASFVECPSDSIDYAVMEKIAGDARFKPAVVILDAGWSDVGAWSSVWQISAQDQQGNAIKGDVQVFDSYNNYLSSEHRLLAVLGCENLIVIETSDAVLVAHKDKAQDVKRIVEDLKRQGRAEWRAHRRVYRPWGSYEGIDLGDRFQVKRLSVKSGGKLSLQMHHHRAEHWIVVQGTARVTRGTEEFLLSENQSTYIPLGVTHRLENPGTIQLEMIEVQSGSYLGEDDIVRFEDIYKRV